MNSENARLFAHTEQLNENIIWVAYTHSPGALKKSALISEEFRPSDVAVNRTKRIGDCVIFKNRRGEVVLKETARSLKSKDVFKYVIDGEPVVKYKHTANGDVAYIENSREVHCGKSFEGALTFDIGEDELLYGLGQHEDGVYDYNGKTEYLYQTNMKISIPFIISSRNYGILIDTESAVVFSAAGGKMTFTLDTVNELSYYVITGDNFDEIVRELRVLTGRAPMLPRWTFGYIQSKERYRSSQELIETTEKFREEDIPLDCIVQDWLSWEDGLWGEKRADKSRYPDLEGLMEELHGKNVKLMVSVWPNMAEGGSNLHEFRQKGMLLPNSTVYDAFNEEARAIYWKQWDEGWFSAGADALWCDNSEPFSDADWYGETKRPEELRYRLVTEASKKSMDWTRLNSYGLFHSKGIYENWRRSGSNKRVVNLTRSSYISAQRYGVIPWSGDISAKWDTLKKQIAEGIKLSLCGMPYWTLDIGGFFTVKDKWENRGCGKAGSAEPLWFWNGDYNDGVNDLGYRELYVRWLQYAAFLPMLRAHGTDTPREPWHYGKEGEPFYDAIIEFIDLRYRLLPYIYSLSALVTRNNDTMLRSLMFDFAYDENIRDICDCFMLGKALLVCPVTEPMYYTANSVPLEYKEKNRPVYLPAQADWYDFWTNVAYKGGQTVKSDAPLERIPLFVKVGSILPLSARLTYADEKGGEVSEILVYGGADGDFALYNDEGDNYSYEEGNLSSIPLIWCDEGKTLTFGKVVGRFKYQEHFMITLIDANQIRKTAELKYAGEEIAVSFRN